MPLRTTGPMRKFTPARVKASGGNKENSVQKMRLNTKYLCPTPNRPSSALTSRHVNIQDAKTPDNKVTLSGFKMSREKERIHQHNHPYIRPIKLKRLGSTPVSASKKPRL